MVDFYRLLLTDVRTKAEALQRARQNLIADPNLRHPYYWGAFLLIGNWL